MPPPEALYPDGHGCTVPLFPGVPSPSTLYLHGHGRPVLTSVAWMRPVCSTAGSRSMCSPPPLQFQGHSRTVPVSGAGRAMAEKDGAPCQSCSHDRRNACVSQPLQRRYAPLVRWSRRRDDNQQCTRAEQVVISRDRGISVYPRIVAGIFIVRKRGTGVPGDLCFVAAYTMVPQNRRGHSVEQPVHGKAAAATASRGQWWQGKVLIQGGKTAHIGRHFVGRAGKSVCLGLRGVQVGDTVAAPSSKKA